MYRNARSFKPDICMSFGGLYTTLLAQLVRAKAISLDDTETAKWQQIICLPLVDLILTPSCYKIDLGKKQIKFPGTMDMAYLHQNRFTPNESVLDELGLEISEIDLP
jgi:predicted glycosyltransferase